MDPIFIAIQNLARVGIIVVRSDFLFGELYEAVGYPELKRNQVFSLARREVSMSSSSWGAEQ